MAGMTKLTAVFHNRLVDESKNTTFRNRINSHSQKKKGYAKTHTNGSNKQGFPGTLGPEIKGVDETWRKMRMRRVIRT